LAIICCTSASVKPALPAAAICVRSSSACLRIRAALATDCSYMGFIIRWPATSPMRSRTHSISAGL
jgi:hypothetical protein